MTIGSLFSGIGGLELGLERAGGGEADRPSRRRKPVEDPSPKRRWVWPASARAQR